MSDASAAATTPATLARRWAAWSLDATLIAAATGVLMSASLRAGLSALDAALAPLLDAVLAAMLATLPGLPAPQRLLADPAVAAATTAFAQRLGHALLPALLVFAALFWCYAAAFECARGATPGKRALGLRVVDAGGTATGCARHALRQASGLLSWLSLNLGHLMAVVPPRHQALHDRIAGLRVVADTDGALPGWARAWLWLQAALGCAAFAALAMLLQGRVDAALVRLLG